MKKILSILGTISLSNIISTNIIACNPQNTKNINNIPNKPNKPIEPQFTPQQPPKNSKGKLVENNYMRKDTGGYIVIHKNSNLGEIEKINSSKKYGTRFYRDIVYKGKLNNEPTNLPKINISTGEITNGNEKIES